jgi:hypothetical protein
MAPAAEEQVRTSPLGRAAEAHFLRLVVVVARPIRRPFGQGTPARVPPSLAIEASRLVLATRRVAASPRLSTRDRPPSSARLDGVPRGAPRARTRWGINRPTTRADPQLTASLFPRPPPPSISPSQDGLARPKLTRESLVSGLSLGPKPPGSRPSGLGKTSRAPAFKVRAPTNSRLVRSFQTNPFPATAARASASPLPGTLRRLRSTLTTLRASDPPRSSSHPSRARR